MKKALSAVMTGILLLTGCAQTPPAPALTEITQVSENKYTCMYEGQKYEYILDLPAQTGGAPLILMLHGYGDTAGGFRTGTAFHQSANPAGCAVVYASGGVGWNAEDAVFLETLVRQLQAEYGLDAARIFAAGFSNGAFMAHRLAAEHADTFSACISVCGTMEQSVWEGRSDPAPVSFFQITGGADAVVPKHSDGSAEHAKDPAIEDVMDSYVQAAGLTLTETAAAGRDGVLKKYGSEKVKTQVWDLYLPAGTHGWRCGGIDTADLILQFLETQK